VFTTDLNASGDSKLCHPFRAVDGRDCDAVVRAELSADRGLERPGRVDLYPAGRRGFRFGLAGSESGSAAMRSVSATNELSRSDFEPNPVGVAGSKWGLGR
jgi:hypothetical protein